MPDDLTVAAGRRVPGPAERVLPYIANERQRYAGAVDHLEPHCGLRGWALDTASPGLPLRLQARSGGRVLAEAPCIMDRPDIDAVVGRLTQCGFIIGWSRFDRAALRELADAAPDAPVEVVVAATGAVVPVVCDPLKLGEIARLALGAPAGDLIPPFRYVNDYLAIEGSGLFDAEWYRAAEGARFDPGMPPLLDYIRRGEAAGARPSFYFDPSRYAAAAGLPTPAGALLHAIREGAGRLPGPHFDEAWYAAAHATPPGAAALAHYLAHRDAHAPNPWFDRAHYAAASGAAGARDLYRHFVSIGFRQGLLPSARFEAAEDALPAEARAWLVALRRELGLVAAPAETPPEAGATRLPDVARLGHAGTEALLRGLAPPARAAVEAAAQDALDADPPLRARAALTLAIARGLAGDAPGAARAAAVFLETPFDLDAATRTEIEGRLEAANHALHERMRAEEAQVVYRLLHARGVRSTLVVLRLLEGALDRRDVEAAAPYAAELEAATAGGLSTWARVALSRYHHLRRDEARAAAVLAGIPPLAGTEPVAEAVVLNRLIESDALDAAAARLAAAPEPLPPQLFAPAFRLAVWRRDAAAADAMLDHPEARNLADWLLAEAIFRVTVPGDAAVGPRGRLLGRVHALLEAQGLRSNAVVQARIYHLLHSRRWDELGALFEEIARTPFGTSRETLLRKLEYYCYADNTDGAEEIYQRHFGGTDLDKWEGITILRLLSELKRWDEAGRVLRTHIAKGHDFGAAVHMAMRVVRKAELHEAVLDAAREAAPRQEPGVRDFLSLVNEDLAIIRSARALTTNMQGGGAGARYRSSWVLQGTEPPEEEEAELCTFLCTNQRYFLSMLTFLCSFLGQAPQVGGRVFVFLDKDVPRHWYGSVAMVAARFNRPVEVVPEADFLGREVEHRVDYGFFAQGGNLSRAAYFRLYAARWLLDRHAFRRAAYIDTDTICRGDLSGLFRLDLGDKLIAAATEDYSLDVANAAARNDLDPTAYFNSGVLLLRFDSAELRAGIEEAIRVSEKEPQRLVFHDQCALNIAFRDRVAALPPRYNFFLRPSRERNGHIEDGLILHFLDRPKPWDIVFDRTYREEWRVWALMLGSILPQGLYVDIFAAANRD
ncbi:glycosyltransferase [Falsiroseomonas sp. CW058]|uniref:glycosyltransferase n=1 Tax=Falsiroseomonas sp. CW058 TaxID=3388664 RepID=UPI003D32459F